MTPDRTIGRYRRWYTQVLRLYPRTFRDRFAEPMTQTFTDLARERADANLGLLGFALGTFADTTTGIVREHMTQIVQARAVVRWVLITAALLAIPIIAMLLQVDRVRWGPLDFAIAGVLILGAGLLFEYASSRGGSLAYRAAVAIAVLAGLGLVWVNLAVGMMDLENGNLLYVLVLFVALVGAAIGRFEPRHAAIAMFMTATVHATVAIIGHVTGLGPTLLADALWVVAWVASGLLFRQAALRASVA
jgi:hypothetical protein